MNTAIQCGAPAHVLLTRYNLPIPGLTLNLNDDWLQHRFELFASHCIPSVTRQNTQQFRWFILVSSVTPKDRLRQLEEVLPANAALLPINGHLDDNPLIESLERAGVPTTTPLLTSRLDNDDAVGSSYMSAMYRAAVSLNPSVEGAAFNMPIGIQVRVRKVYGLIDLDNPFMSLLERTHPKRTVLGVSHREIKNYAKVHQIRIGPQWAQVVHKRNLDNRIRGVRLPRRLLIRSFPPFPDLPATWV